MVVGEKQENYPASSSFLDDGTDDATADYDKRDTTSSGKLERASQTLPLSIRFECTLSLANKDIIVDYHHHRSTHANILVISLY